MTPERNDFVGEVIGHLVKYHQAELPPLDKHSDLLELGIVDSLSLIQLLFHVEDKYGVRIPFDDISPANVSTPSRIYDLVFAPSRPTQLQEGNRQR